MKKTVSPLKSKILFVLVAMILLSGKVNGQTVPPVWPAKSIAIALESLKKEFCQDTTKAFDRKKKQVKNNRKEIIARDSVFINRDKKLKDSVLKTWRY